MLNIPVKSTRRRYIGFSIESSQNYFKKKDVIEQLNKECNYQYNKNCKEMGIYLIRLKQKKGIIRCNHTEKENTINLLNSIKKVSDVEVKIQTFATSGTIKSLIKKHINDY